MADLERLTDDLWLHLARTPAQHAFRRGYIAGKTYARLQVLILFASVAGLVLLAMYWYGA